MSEMQNQLDQAIAQLQAQVTTDTSATHAAVSLTSGIINMIQQAMAQAIAEGATPTQLQAITNATNAIQRKARAFGQAVSANTPATQQPPTPAQEAPAPAHGITAPGPAPAA
jgi:hypothetical protein